MNGGIIGKNIGAISGIIDGTAGKEFLAIELSVKQNKVISGLACSFQIPNGQTQATKPFLLSRLIVAKKSISELGLSNDPYQAIQFDLLFDQYITEYRGIAIPCYFSSAPVETLSVILLPAFVTTDLVNAAALYGTLSIEGTETGDSNLRIRTVN